MKSILTIPLFFFASVIFAQSELPDVTLKTLAGQSITLDEAVKDGRVTVLDFWATWCKPCIKELDELAWMYKDWQDSYDVEIIAITIDNARNIAKVAPLLEEKGWEYTILSDVNQQLMKSLAFQSVPQVFVVDKNKQIVWSHTGYVPGDEEELEHVIAEYAQK
jgi:thiol-disulfide isomerase/thioredoxin